MADASVAVPSSDQRRFRNYVASSSDCLDASISCDSVDKWNSSDFSSDEDDSQNHNGIFVTHISYDPERWNFHVLYVNDVKEFCIFRMFFCFVSYFINATAQIFYPFLR